MKAIALAVVLSCWCGWPAAAAADTPRLFVVDLSQQALPAPYETLDLSEHVGRTLTAAGCQVERTCRTESCLEENNATPGVRLLTFEVSYDRERYSCAVAMEVRDQAGGRLLHKENSSSPVCPAADLLDHTAKAARVACAELRRAPPPEAAPPPQLVTAAAPPRSHRLLTTALVGLGAGSLATGAALMYFHGSDTDCVAIPGGTQCRASRQTTRAAIPLFLVGAALTGWGTYRLVGPRAPSVTVSVLGRGLSMEGRF